VPGRPDPAAMAQWVDATLPTGCLPWQRRFVRLVAGAEISALSLARGAGKTTLLGHIASGIVHPEGPWHHPDSELVIVAPTMDQGSAVFAAASDGLAGHGADLGDRRTWSTNASNVNRAIRHRATGAEIKIKSSRPEGLHGLGSRPGGLVMMLDEPAQWRRPEETWAVIAGALGKETQISRIIVIGTQHRSPDHFFSRLLRGAQGCESVVYQADPEAGPTYSMAQAHRANPSLRAFGGLAGRVRRELEECRQPAASAATRQQVRASRLNLPESTVLESLLVSAEDWARAEGDADAAGPCHWGVDLGTSHAMSAVAAWWPATGLLRVVACLPSEPSLLDRGDADGVGGLYSRMADLGELFCAGRRTVDVAALLDRALDEFGQPSSISCDRWRIHELRDLLDRGPISWCPTHERGQGYRDGGEDLREFRRAVAAGQVTAPVSLLLRSALASARAVSDPAGNEKLAKSSEGGRNHLAKDDAAAAAVLAVAAGRRWQARSREVEGQTALPVVAGTAR